MLRDLLVRRRAHVQQERHAYVPLDLVPPPVDLVRRRVARPPLDRVVSHRVEIDLLTVQQPLDLAEHLRPQQLELTPRLVHQRGVLRQRLVEVLRVALAYRVLDDAAPARPVVRGAEVPLVVEVVLRLDWQLAFVVRCAEARHRLAVL